jgi:hypothetical protein
VPAGNSIVPGASGLDCAPEGDNRQSGPSSPRDREKWSVVSEVQLGNRSLSQT